MEVNGRPSQADLERAAHEAAESLLESAGNDLQNSMNGWATRGGGH